MAINVNSTVLTNGLIGYYDVLNIKSIGPDFNGTLQWKDLQSLNQNTILQGSVSVGAEAPRLSFTQGENIIIKGIETVSSTSLASFLKATYTNNKTIRTISFWVKKILGDNNQGSNPFFFRCQF
jgi:hypothetical protein